MAASRMLTQTSVGRLSSAPVDASDRDFARLGQHTHYGLGEVEMYGVEPSPERRVLVVDDNRAIHEDFRKILKGDRSTSNGDEIEAFLFGETVAAADRPIYCIDDAFQGQEALEKVARSRRAKQPYELAFVDMRMPPGWNGADTIEQIWKEDSEVQVVICTAYSDYSWSDLFARFGGNDQLLILKKPFDRSEVEQLAAALTEKWRLSQRARLRMAELQEMVETQTRDLRAEMRERERIADELRWMSEHDPLSKLLNRRAFQARLTQEWHRATRYGSPLSCAVVDLDHFKRINDNHGHAAGDAAIVTVARLLENQSRPSDVVCRYGGEEFCILLPSTNEQAAALWGERVRAAIARSATRIDHVELQVRASIGVAELTSEAMSAEQLINAADQALGVAKQSGRNRVVPSSALATHDESPIGAAKPLCLES